MNVCFLWASGLCGCDSAQSSFTQRLRLSTIWARFFCFLVTRGWGTRVDRWQHGPAPTPSRGHDASLEAWKENEGGESVALSAWTVQEVIWGFKLWWPKINTSPLLKNVLPCWARWFTAYWVTCLLSWTRGERCCASKKLRKKSEASWVADSQLTIPTYRPITDPQTSGGVIKTRPPLFLAHLTHLSRPVSSRLLSPLTPSPNICLAWMLHI